MRSTAPLTETTHRRAKDKSLASSMTSSGVWMLSTPLVPCPERSKARISEALPRIIVGWISAVSCCAVAVRYVVAPQPTGSNTTGMPRRWA